MVKDGCKECPKCSNTLKVEEFYKVNRTTGDGYSGYCRKCTAAKAVEWQKGNPEADKAIRDRREEKLRQLRPLATEEERAERQKKASEYYWGSSLEKNRKRAAAWKAKRRKEDPETVRAECAIQCGKRRCRLKGYPSDLTVEDWRLVLAAFNRSCAICGAKSKYFDMDHVIPIHLGGYNVVGNVVPLCRPCNGEKSRRDPKEFAAYAGWDIEGALRKAKVRESTYPICADHYKL